MKYPGIVLIPLALCLVCLGPAHAQQPQPVSAKTATPAVPNKNKAPPPQNFPAYRVLPPAHPGDKYLRYDHKPLVIAGPAPDLSAEASAKAEGATHKKAAPAKRAGHARPSLPAKVTGDPP